MSADGGFLGGAPPEHAYVCVCIEMCCARILVFSVAAAAAVADAAAAAAAAAAGHPWQPQHFMRAHESNLVASAAVVCGGCCRAPVAATACHART